MSSQKALIRLMGAPVQRLPTRGILFHLRMNGYRTHAVPGHWLGATQGDHGFGVDAMLDPEGEEVGRVS